MLGAASAVAVVSALGAGFAAASPLGAAADTGAGTSPLTTGVAVAVGATGAWVSVVPPAGGVVVSAGGVVASAGAVVASAGGGVWASPAGGSCESM